MFCLHNKKLGVVPVLVINCMIDPFFLLFPGTEDWGRWIR